MDGEVADIVLPGAGPAAQRPYGTGGTGGPVVLGGADASPLASLLELGERAIAATGCNFTISDAALPDNPLVYVNRAFEVTTGYAASEVLGRNCRFLQGDQTDPEAVGELRRALAERRSATVTLLNLRRDGSSFWNEVSVSPVFDPAGRLTHFVGVQQDVTARVVAEASRDRHHEAEQEARLEAEAAQGRFAFLADVSARFDASLDVDAIVAVVAGAAVERLADVAVVAVDGDDHGGAIVHVVARPGRTAPEVDDTVLRRLLAVGRAMPVGTLVQRGDDDAGRAVRDLGHHVGAVLPLRARDRRFGTLVLLRSDPSMPSAAELELTGELARRAAVALDNAHRFRERDEIARILQASLLPPATPELPGAQLATRYVPRGSGVDVGGDFWDAFDTGDGWGIAIGDVCGKGPHAAAVTGLARHTVRAAAMHQVGPSAVLAVLNRSLCNLEGLGDRFVTACYASYAETGDGARLSLSLGGHPNPVLWRDGACVQVGEAGTLLGLFEDVELHDSEVQLSPGDAIVFVTDGILEAPGPDGRFEEAALGEVVAAAGRAGLDADGMADAVVVAALDHAGGEAADDLCVVVIAIPPS